jgi:putative membrane protein
MSAILKFVTLSAVVILAVGATHAALAVDALPDARFVGFVQEANDFELGSSNLALQRSSNEAIRGYANRMLVERGEMAGLLSKARSEAGVSYAPTPGGSRPRHADVLDRLGMLQGGEFDNAYASAQLAAQIEAVAQVGAYSQNGGNGNLKKFAQEALPKLEAELEHAKRIAGQ